MKKAAVFSWREDRGAHQSAGEADHSDGSLGRLGDVKQVVEQRLVLMVGEQVELVQDEQHRAAAAAIAWRQTQTSTVMVSNSKRCMIRPEVSHLSSTPPARKPDSLQNFPEMKQKQIFLALLFHY